MALNKLDPLNAVAGAAVLPEPGAEDCDCCVVAWRPKESGLDGGGPAGVVDVFPNAKLEAGLLVGVEAPPNSVDPPALPPPPNILLP